MPACRTLFRVALPTLAALLLLATTAYAQNDSRMVVEVPKNEQGEMPAVRDAIQSALPLLWDRILPRASRAAVSDSINATPFLQRVVPHSDGMQVSFNEQRVWQYLDQQQVAYLKEPPHLNVRIQMFNQSDLSMPKTAEALQQYAQQVAKERGIVLDAQAPLVTANWRWLDASQVSLQLHGDGISEAAPETRTLAAGDPLEQLQAWVTDMMLQLRDADVADSGMPKTPASEQPAQNEIGILLTIDQQAPLPEQVVLEDALRQNSQVISMIPVYLAANSRQYRLQLRDNDDSWIESWFRRRGMQAQATPEGWLVR